MKTRSLMNTAIRLGAILAPIILGSAIVHAGDITPASATATFSQGGFPVGNTIDLDPTTSGWAIHQGGGSPDETFAQTAFYELATHAGPAGATDLTFSIAHNDGNIQHSVGKFRLSATNSEGSIGAGSNWVVLTPTNASGSNGGTFTVNPDNSVLVSGANPASNVYTVTASTSLLGVSGFRLETLEDTTLPLPTNGPGRSFNGNFVMTDFAVDANTRVALQNATATLSQTSCCGGDGLLVSDTINGISGGNFGGEPEGWGFDAGGSIQPSTAAFETVSDVGFSTGTKLQIGIDHRNFADHNLAKFRIAVTTADRSQFADGLANGGDVGAGGIWTVIRPLRATSENGGIAYIDADDSITLSGPNPQFDTYTVQGLTNLTGITGVRLEVLSPPGRAGNGNAVVTEFSLDAAKTQRIALQNASATFDQGSPFVVASAIDGVVGGGASGWAVFGGHTQNQSAVFQTVTPISANTLNFTLENNFNPGDPHLIKSFRLSVTSDLNPDATGVFNWTEISPELVLLDNSAGFSISNNIITLSGLSTSDRYTVLAHGIFSNITGFRVETFTVDGTLGFSSNGNFVLSEFIVEVPEPGAATLLGLGVLGLIAQQRCRKRSAPTTDFLRVS